MVAGAVTDARAVTVAVTEGAAVMVTVAAGSAVAVAVAGMVDVIAGVAAEARAYGRAPAESPLSGGRSRPEARPPANEGVRATAIDSKPSATGRAIIGLPSRVRGDARASRMVPRRIEAR